MRTHACLHVCLHACLHTVYMVSDAGWHVPRAQEYTHLHIRVCMCMRERASPEPTWPNAPCVVPVVLSYLRASGAPAKMLGLQWPPVCACVRMLISGCMKDVCMHVYIYMYIYIHVYIYMHTCIQVCIQLVPRIYFGCLMHACAYVYLCTWGVYIYICVCVCMHIYMYYTYI